MVEAGVSRAQLNITSKHPCRTLEYDIIGNIKDSIILRKVSEDGNPTVTRDAYDGMS